MLKLTSYKELNGPSGARLLIQIGLAIVFLYAAIATFQKPDDWTTYLPSFLPKSLSPITAVKAVAFYEAILAVWLLSGKYLKAVGLLAAITFAGILAVNTQYLLTTFRDIGLLFMALALYFLARE